MDNFALLSIGMGIVDGFNVCSLGALILIISLVLAFKSRKMILLAGGTFILTSVVIYGALIFLWHRIFTYLMPYQGLFQVIIGGLSLAGALYFLKVFIDALRYGPTCSSSENSIVTWAVGKVEAYFKKTGYIAVLTGSLLFAAIVTIVEFPCSAAVPLVFVGMLSDAGLSSFATFGYVSLFLLFYMLDEILVFGVAVWAKKIWLASPKLITISSFIGFALLFLISLHYLFGLSFLPWL